MTDATTQRVSTERARELVVGATPTPWRAGRDSFNGYAVFGSGDGGNVGRYVVACINDTAGSAKGDAALIAAAPDLAADLIAARERIAALEAERDARVTVEEHARAVWEGWTEIGGWSNRWEGADGVDVEEGDWSVSRTRRDLIATLTPRVGPKRAAELADGVGGDS